MKISVIILAAGISSRHPDKLFRKIDGKTVIEKTISTFTDFAVEISVVLGFQAGNLREIIEKQFDEKVRILENPHFQKGKSTSIHAGISACADADYFGFCNADLPFIKSQTVANLLEILKTEKPLILAPKFQNKMGHPTFFHQKLRNKLLQISGNFGGKYVVNAHPETVFVAVKDSGVTLDMDKSLENEKF